VIVFPDFYFCKYFFLFGLKGDANMFEFDVDDDLDLHVVQVSDDQVAIILKKQAVWNLNLIIYQFAAMGIAADWQLQILSRTDVSSLLSSYSL
jgi:hypothetical protein